MKGINFIALDFETANVERSSVCEIGLSFVENGKIVDTRSWLVKPKDNLYDDFNIWIHGITPEDTENSPEFDVIWKEIFPLIHGKFLIAHNAAFDMYVLRDVLNLYGLEYPDIKTYCSYTLSKRVFQGLYSYNLQAVCDHLNISINDRHRASGDAYACAEICLKCFQEGQITDFEQLAEKYRMKPGVMISKDRNYTGPYSIRKDKEVLDARQISGDISKHNPDSLFYEKYIVFTGTLSSMERKQAMQIVADIGGIPENGITQKTNFLVVGQQNFKVVGESGLSGKQKKAYELLQKGQDIEIMSEQDFMQNIPYEPIDVSVAEKSGKTIQIGDVKIEFRVKYI